MINFVKGLGDIKAHKLTVDPREM